MNSAQDQANAAAALGGMMGVGMILFMVVVWVAIIAFMIWLFYRIFTKAGMSGALAFLLLIPGIGPLIAICILAFGTWRVVPAPAVAYSPTPLAGGYPPQQLPPSNYPASQ
jgi:uncharacterized membrane protein YhaH (DUF805 family)